MSERKQQRTDAGPPDRGGSTVDESGEPESSPGRPVEIASPDSLSRDELEQAVEQGQADIGRLQDQLLRRQAEIANFRRRVLKERGETATIAQAELLESLVPIVDDFERAVGSRVDDVGAYHEGIELILRRLQAVLEKLGVERIDPIGEVFDPREHEAIARSEDDDVPDGQVVDVYHVGYRLRDRLVRPASVVVSYNSAAETPGEAPAETPGDASSDEAPHADDQNTETDDV